VIHTWLDHVKSRLDQQGMIAHQWDPVADKVMQSVRGSSQALINALLPIIDHAFATQQFDLFRENFFMERLGLPAVREHPQGSWGLGDIDSGPVILGGGATATIVGAAACRRNGDAFHAMEFDATVEGFGLPLGSDAKRYIFGALPIADLFIAWSRSMKSDAAAVPPPRFLTFHLWSLLLLALLWSLALLGWWHSWSRARRNA
jgi:hypothetical protein